MIPKIPPTAASFPEISELDTLTYSANIRRIVTFRLQAEFLELLDFLS